MHAKRIMTVKPQLIATLVVASVPTSAVSLLVADGSCASTGTVQLPTGIACYPRLQVRPTTIMLSCVDGNEYFGSIKWTRWGAISAIGFGL